MLDRPSHLNSNDELPFEDFDAATRDEQRHIASYCAELRFDEDGQSRACTASTLNISEGGCAVRIYGTITPGSTATLWIAVGADPIALPVRVVWTGSEARGHVAGLAFDGLTGTQQLQIQGLIRAQEQSTTRAYTS